MKKETMKRSVLSLLLCMLMVLQFTVSGLSIVTYAADEGVTNNITPYQVSGKASVRNGDYNGRFSMMGIEYYYGVVIENSGWGKAEFLFNLDGTYDAVEFDVGNIDGGDDKTHVMQIYTDGVFYEEFELTYNMPTQHYIVNVDGVKQLRFVTKDEVYGFSYGIANINAYTAEGAAANGVTIPKRISSELKFETNLENGENILPYQTNGAVSTRTGDHNGKFFMMGIECFDGVVMKNDGWGRSEFLYNLGGKYETVEFDIGNIDGGEDRTHVLQIYKDEVYSGEIELTHNMETYHYVVNVSGTSQLRFVTKDEVYGFSYAIANVNAFTTAENITNGKIVPEIISGLSVYHTNYDYGENTNPYQTTGKIQVHDINTNTSFNVMGKEYKDGITLSSDGWGMGEALFNFGGQYKSITFDYGHIDGSGERTVILEIHINGLYVQELELTGSMLNRTVTIDLNGVNQLKLTTKSEVYGFGYAIFNIKVEETGRDIPNRFTDVKHGQWYYDSVLNVANLGFMNGTNTARTLFSPSMEFTREQFVQLLFNIEGLKAEDYQGATGFSDARSGQWYSAAVKWAKENGITNGIGDGKFGLGGKVTREQIAVFLMNYAKLKGQNTSVNADISSFNDGASVSSWAVDGVKWAVGCGFLGSTSTSAKVLSPLKVAIRSEIAKITMSYNDMFLA